MKPQRGFIYTPIGTWIALMVIGPEALVERLARQERAAGDYGLPEALGDRSTGRPEALVERLARQERAAGDYRLPEALGDRSTGRPEALGDRSTGRPEALGDPCGTGRRRG
jgi:hypothetical protein